MKKDTKESIAILMITILVVGGLYGYIQYESDVNPTFTNIESQSMQHSHTSQIGLIDTGDMVILKTKDNADKDAYGHLITYVEGSKTNVSSFGEYGTVVVYERDNSTTANPIIHRLILWLDYDETTGHWSASSLANYSDWSCSTGSSDWNDLSGTLTLSNVGYSSKSVSIDLDQLAVKAPHSGYLTMGDNSDNSYFDQLTIVIGLVTEDQINSVAWIEIPWGGIIKLISNGKNDVIDTWVPNSIPCMIISIFAIILSIIAVSSIYSYYELSKYYKRRNNK
jgi:signal peptidase I